LADLEAVDLAYERRLTIDRRRDRARRLRRIERAGVDRLVFHFLRARIVRVMSV
jgi:hypothetical protein